jgi:hypothetical protein
MVEKQMAAHRVDRAICAWFWDYVAAHAAGDPSKVKTPALAYFSLFPTFAYYCYILEPYFVFLELVLGLAG